MWMIAGQLAFHLTYRWSLAILSMTLFNVDLRLAASARAKPTTTNFTLRRRGPFIDKGRLNDQYGLAWQDLESGLVVLYYFG